MQLKYKEDSGSFDVTEAKFEEVEAKYMFLIKTLGWKEGLDGEHDIFSDANPNDVTKLAKDLWLTEQMAWCKGLELFGER